MQLHACLVHLDPKGPVWNDSTEYVRTALKGCEGYKPHSYTPSPAVLQSCLSRFLS